MVCDNKSEDTGLTVRECLEGALKELDHPSFNPNKVVVLLLDDRDQGWLLASRAGSNGEHMKCSHIIPMLECYKASCLQSMGF